MRRERREGKKGQDSTMVLYRVMRRHALFTTPSLLRGMMGKTERKRKEGKRSGAQREGKREGGSRRRVERDSSCATRLGIFGSIIVKISLKQRSTLSCLTNKCSRQRQKIASRRRKGSFGLPFGHELSSPWTSLPFSSTLPPPQTKPHPSFLLSEVFSGLYYHTQQ